MKKLITTGRQLARLCLANTPDLQAVEVLCGTTFQEVLNSQDGWTPVFDNTDDESSDGAKATFVAHRWFNMQAFGVSLTAAGDNRDIFILDEEECELYCLAKTFDLLHSIQLRKDPRFMTVLKDKERKSREDAAKRLRGEN